MPVFVKASRRARAHTRADRRGKLSITGYARSSLQKARLTHQRERIIVDNMLDKQKYVRFSGRQLLRQDSRMMKIGSITARAYNAYSAKFAKSVGKSPSRTYSQALVAFYRNYEKSKG